MRMSYVVIVILHQRCRIATRWKAEHFQTIYVGNNKADADKAYDDCSDAVRMETWQNGQKIVVKMK